MSWPPYSRNLAGRNRGPVFPPPPAGGPVAVARRRAWRSLVVVFVYLAQAMLLTANAAWWHVQGYGMMTGFFLGNAILASGLILWMRRR